MINLNKIEGDNFYGIISYTDNFTKNNTYILSPKNTKTAMELKSILQNLLYKEGFKDSIVFLTSHTPIDSKDNQ